MSAHETVLKSAPKSDDGLSRTRVATRAFAELPNADQAVDLLAEIQGAKSDCGPVAIDAPLALYGAGNLGRLAREHLAAVGQDISFVVDRNAASLAGDPRWEGVSIISPEDVPADMRAQTMLAVSVVLAPFAPLQNALLAEGWASVVPYYDVAESFRALHPLSNGWFAAPFTDGEIKDMADVARAWTDDISRAHYLQFIAWRRLREEWTFDEAPVTTGDRFFIPEIRAVMSDREAFVDAGAHDGAVTLRFADLTAGQFASIHAIEPDETNRWLLEKAVNGLSPDRRARVTICDALLAERAEEVTFHDGLGYASQISATGQSKRKTATLDGLNVRPTFLKLHLEGGELPALKGARDLLRAYRPVIVATVYHNDDGLSATAAWFMQHLPGYRFLFRLHSWCGTSAVIYAIPEERHTDA